MDFLLEPIEPGIDLDKLIETASTITCDAGYACKTGKVQLVN